MGNFLGMVGILKSDGLDVLATAQELIYLPHFINFSSK